jgi:hypothetical protein
LSDVVTKVKRVITSRVKAVIEWVIVKVGTKA